MGRLVVLVVEDVAEDESQEDTGAVEMVEVVAVQDEAVAFAFQPQRDCRWEDLGCKHRWDEAVEEAETLERVAVQELELPNLS